METLSSYSSFILPDMIVLDVSVSNYLAIMQVGYVWRIT
jgi:hypothetical protein